MDRTELLSRVNARSEARFGEQIDESVLDYLIEHDVVPGPERTASVVVGANYQYSENAVRQLTRVRWLKARGLSRSSLLRVFLWLAYLEVPFGRFREDLQKEFARAVGRLLRPVSSTFDPTKRAVTERDVSTLNRQLGHVDPRLLPGDQTLDPMGLVDAYSLMRFGLNAGFDESVVRDLVAKLGFSTVIEQTGSDSFALIRKSARDLLADPEERESAVAGLISKFDEASCDRAREVLDQLPWVMTKGHRIFDNFGLTWAPDPKILEPHSKLVASALFQPEFRITSFVQMVVAVQLGETDGIFDRTLLTMIRNMRDGVT